MIPDEVRGPRLIDNDRPRPYTAGMRARPPRLAASAVLAVLCAPLAAFGQTRIDAAEGKVEVSPSGLRIWLPVTSPPYTMKDGDRVRTADGATASIVLPDNSRVQIASGSELTAESVGKKEASLRLDSGGLRAWVAKGLSKHFRVDTPSASAYARGTQFGVEVTATRDTQVEVDEGVVAVRLKSGEETELGQDRPYRSLLVIPGRPLSLLPHPHEDAGGRKSARRPADCLHGANGAMRASVEQIEACQARSRAQRAKSAPLSESEKAADREHDRAEIKRFLQASGELPGGTDEDLGQTVDGGDPAPGSGVRDVGAETSSLMKELGLPDSAGAGPLASLPPAKIKALQDAMVQQHANPAIQAAFAKAVSGQGGSLTDDELQALIKNLHLENVNLDPSGKTPPPPPPSDPDAP